MERGWEEGEGQGRGVGVENEIGKRLMGDEGSEGRC